MVERAITEMVDAQQQPDDGEGQEWPDIGPRECAGHGHGDWLGGGGGRAFDYLNHVRITLRGVGATGRRVRLVGASLAACRLDDYYSIGSERH